MIEVTKNINFSEIVKLSKIVKTPNIPKQFKFKV